MIRYMKIGEICDILNGYAFKSSRYINNKGIRVIRITNVQKGYIEDAEPKFYPEKEINEIKKFMLEDGDLLISLTGNVGRVALIDKSMLPAALNQRVGCIRVNKKDLIYKPYLYHLLNSDYFEKQCINSSNGIAQKNMSTEWLKEYYVPVYSMDYQKKIATIFDKIDIVIKKHYKQIEILDKIAKSLFIEMFGDIINTSKYPTVNLGSLGEMLSGGTPSSEHSEYFGGNIPFISTPCLGENYISYKNAQNFLTDEGVKNSTTNLIPAYSVMIGSRVGVGKCSINMCEMCTNQDILSFINIDKTKYDLLFIKNVIEQHFDFYESQKRGATIKGISSKIVKETKVPKAPLLLQKKFANFVRGTDKSKLAVKKSLEELEILKKSLMQEYFA